VRCRQAFDERMPRVYATRVASTTHTSFRDAKRAPQTGGVGRGKQRFRAVWGPCECLQPLAKPLGKGRSGMALTPPSSGYGRLNRTESARGHRQSGHHGAACSGPTLVNRLGSPCRLQANQDRKGGRQPRLLALACVFCVVGRPTPCPSPRILVNIVLWLPERARS
jgi:hypothetical protein